jgi:hypothetical protein
MPSLLGITPQYGIPSQEDGLLLDSLDFSWSGEWYDQKNNKGRVCGKLLVDESISVSMAGAVALGNTLTIKGGAALTLANTVPDLWAETPEATTSVVTDLSRSYASSDAQKMNVSLSIYAFGPAEA